MSSKEESFLGRMAAHKLLPTLLITGVVLIYFINLHARLQYGRYATELKLALMELVE